MADRLRQRILSGEVPDGGLLPKIDDLMAEFAVSRPAARQACAILETEGLLRVRRGHQGGAVVHLPGPGNAAYALAQVLEVRQVGVDDVAAAVARLEPLCAEMCAERTDRETAVLPVLRAAQAELATAIEQGRAVEASRAARRWHEALVDGCGNETSRALLGTLEAVWTSHARASAVDFASRGVPFSEASSRRVHAEHAQIERLIAAGDGPAAAEAARRHLGTARIHDDGAAGARDGAVRARHVRDALAGWPTG
jgi:DNA-binding FadR family transcriptional regulator